VRRRSGLSASGRDKEAAVDALIDLLNQAADHVPNEDDTGALKKAGRLLKGAPASVLSDVIEPGKGGGAKPRTTRRARYSRRSTS
jgi:hypothetical protein